MVDIRGIVGLVRPTTLSMSFARACRQRARGHGNVESCGSSQLSVGACARRVGVLRALRVLQQLAAYSGTRLMHRAPATSPGPATVGNATCRGLRPTRGSPRPRRVHDRCAVGCFPVIRKILFRLEFFQTSYFLVSLNNTIKTTHHIIIFYRLINPRN